MKNILVINGHPDSQSYNYSLSDAYIKGLKTSGSTFDELYIGKLNFNPNLSNGYRMRTELEPDLIEAKNKIEKADHIIWFYPLWWGSMPAIMKGFIDRVFLPGIAFRYRDNSSLWDKLWEGKTAHLIITMDYPVWYYKWILGEQGTRFMRKMILDFCGIKTSRTTYIAPVKNSTETFRLNQLKKVEEFGKRQV